YAVEETRQGPFSLLVTQSGNGSAFGSTYLADGVSDPPGPSTTFTVHATKISMPEHSAFCRSLRRLPSSALPRSQQ
ncbi:hypothetical protein B0H13DRAFT_1634879, partial [Mycena leptocephala]